MKKVSANEAALVSSLQWAVMGIVTAVVIFGDVMFIKLMWGYFPDGILRIGALGGAIATAASILVLLLGKKHWFRPGGQLIAAYLFTAVEVLVSVSNVLYASGVQDGIMAFWRDLSPATPFVALVGWVIILQLDRSTQDKHEEMELQDEIAASQREFRSMQHEASMEVRRKALEYNKQYTLEALDSAASQESIRRGAELLTRTAIQQLTGHYVPTNSTPRVVDALPAGQPATESTLPTTTTQPIATLAQNAPAPTPPPVQQAATKPSFFSRLLGTVDKALQPAQPVQAMPTLPPVKPPAAKPLSSNRSAVEDRKAARLRRLRGTNSPLA